MYRHPCYSDFNHRPDLNKLVIHGLILYLLNTCFQLKLEDYRDRLKKGEPLNQDQLVSFLFLYLRLLQTFAAMNSAAHDRLLRCSFMPRQNTLA